MSNKSITYIIILFCQTALLILAKAEEDLIAKSEIDNNFSPFIKDKFIAEFSSAFIHDSNVFFTRDALNDSILNSSLAIGYKGGRSDNDPGLFFKLMYNPEFYKSLNEDVDYESDINQKLHGEIEYKGAFTKVGFDFSVEEIAGIGRNSYVGDGLRNISEYRNIGYEHQQFNPTLTRRLDSGLVDLGLIYNSYRFNEVLYDRDKLNLLFNWYFQLPFLSKTLLGFGVNAGEEEVLLSQYGQQQFWSPTIRASWQYSEKTKFLAWVGFDERAQEKSNYEQRFSTFGIKGTWQATESTKVELDILKDVVASVSNIDSNIATGRYSISIEQGLGESWSISSAYTYEKANYENITQSTPVNFFIGRREKVHNYEISLNRKFNFFNFRDSKISILYNHLTNSSKNAKYDFSKNQYGLRIGFSY